MVDFGYRFLKLDFLFGGAEEGMRHDPYATGVEAYRRGMEAIRESVGNDVYILGCGAPIPDHHGLFDGNRSRDRARCTRRGAAGCRDRA